MEDLSADWKNWVTLLTGNFKSKEQAEEFMKIGEINGERKPLQFMDAFKLKGNVEKKIAILHFEKASKMIEELFSGLPYGGRIEKEMLARFPKKKAVKRMVSTVIAIYDFDLMEHLDGRDIFDVRNENFDVFYIDIMRDRDNN
jgi:hypothetical protein